MLQALGGKLKVQQIVQDFYHRLAQDTLVGFFFDGKDVDAIARRQVDFLTWAWARLEQGAESPTLAPFEGKMPAKAHQALPPILKGHFHRRLTLLRQTLQDHHVAKELIEAWVGFEQKFAKQIIAPHSHV